MPLYLTSGQNIINQLNGVNMKKLQIILLLLLFISSFANEWLKKGDEAKAIEDQIKYYEKAIEADPVLKIAYRKLGYRYRKLQKFNKAINCYNRCLELDPKNAKDLYRRGICNYSLDRDSLAFSDFDQAVKINPDLKNSYYYSYIENVIPEYKISEIDFLTINTNESDSIKTLKSLTKNNDFYLMSYSGDYGTKLKRLEREMFEEWDSLKTSDKNEIHCSMFASSGESPLQGRNMDNPPRGVLATLCKPNGGYASVSFSILDELGFGVNDDPTTVSLEERKTLLDVPFWPVDGMNECGLAISISALPEPTEIVIDKTKETIYFTHLIREILDHAKNVDEAIRMINNYNIYDNGKVITHHYFISDASGKSVIAEYHNAEWKIIESKDSWQAVTNYPLYNISEESAKQTCHRYKTLAERLAEKKGNLTWFNGMEFLKKVSNEITQWSVVYDTKQREVYAAVHGRYRQIFKIRMK